MTAETRGSSPAANATASASGALPPSVFRYSPWAIALVTGVVALLLIPFWISLVWLWNTWMDRPEFSHGPLLPLVAAFLVWQQRDRLETMAFKGHWAGPAIVAVACAMYVLGSIGAVYTLQQYAFVVAIAGLALSLCGARAFPLLVAPLVVLVLMIPQPNFILNNLSAKLQLLSSSIGVAVIRALGISVFLEGNIIDLGNYRLQVLEACDGMRYLFPLMTIGLLIAFFYKGAMWKRVTVFLLSVPITVLMNSLRVGMIGVLVDRWGAWMAEGFLHEFQGWMVFMLSAMLLIGCLALMNRIGRETAPWRELFGVSFPEGTPANARVFKREVPTPFYASIAVLVVLAAAAITIPQRAEVVPARQSFAVFPVDVGGWVGKRMVLEADVLQTLQLDDYLLADYHNPAGEHVDFYVSYYGSQRDRRVVHSPRACIPGGGWHIDRFDQKLVGTTGVRVDRMVITNGDARQLVYYWFDQRGRNLTNEFAVKWYLFWDAVTRQRTDGAMIRLVTTIDRVGGEQAADARLTAFATEIAPRMSTFVPH
jgi:exosortase D (VPLPA-CTERM-specific)